MVFYRNSPLSKELIETLKVSEREYKEAGLVGIISTYRLDCNFFTLVVEIDKNTYVEACFSIHEGMNTELYEFLLDFHCLFRDMAVLRGIFDQMAVDILFEYSKTCGTFFPKKICTSETHSTFSGEMSSCELEKVMHKAYCEQLYEEKGRNWR